MCVNPEVVGLIPAKTPKIENLDLHGFELHTLSNKGTELLLQVIKSIINQLRAADCQHFHEQDGVHRVFGDARGEWQEIPIQRKYHETNSAT